MGNRRSGRQRRQERALDRLAHALRDPDHEWRRLDGRDEANAAARALLTRGVLPPEGFSPEPLAVVAPVAEDEVEHHTTTTEASNA